MREAGTDALNMGWHVTVKVAHETSLCSRQAVYGCGVAALLMLLGCATVKTAAAAVKAAAVKAAAVEATVVEGVTLVGAMDVMMEVAIVKSPMEISANEAVEANATVIGPIIVPVWVVPGGRLVIRYGHDTPWRGWLGSAGRVRSNRGVWSSGRGWRGGRVRGTFSGRGGIRRRRGAAGGRRWARHKIVAVCRDRLIRATGKPSRRNHRNNRG